MMWPMAISLFTITWLRLKRYPLIFQELHHWSLPGQYWTENKEEDRCASVIINSFPVKSHWAVRHDILGRQPELKGMCWESHSGQQHANITLLMRRHTSKMWQQLHPWRKANKRQTNKQRATQIESLIAHVSETKQDLKVFLCRCSDNSCYPSRFPTYRLCACADSQIFLFYFFTKGTFSCYNV